MSDLPDKLGALRAVVDALDRCRILGMLIGGLAVGIRTGVPRATLDIDIAVPSATDRDVLIRALGAAGFEHTGTFAHSVNFRHKTGEPLQIAVDPRFDPMIARSEEMTFGDLTLRVVTKADLIEMKRLAARDPSRRRSKALRDEADLALLEGDVPDPDEGW